MEEKSIAQTVEESEKYKDNLALIAASQAGDGAATEQLVLQNGGLVRSIALRFLGRLALCRHFGCRLRIIDADERVMKIFLLSGMERIEGLVIEGLCEKEGIL